MTTKKHLFAGAFLLETDVRRDIIGNCNNPIAAGCAWFAGRIVFSKTTAAGGERQHGYCPTAKAAEGIDCRSAAEYPAAGENAGGESAAGRGTAGTKSAIHGTKRGSPVAAAGTAALYD